MQSRGPKASLVGRYISEEVDSCELRYSPENVAKSSSHGGQGFPKAIMLTIDSQVPEPPLLPWLPKWSSGFPGVYVDDRQTPKFKLSSEQINLYASGSACQFGLPRTYPSEGSLDDMSAWPSGGPRSGDCPLKCHSSHRIASRNISTMGLGTIPTDEIQEPWSVCERSRARRPNCQMGTVNATLDDEVPRTSLENLLKLFKTRGTPNPIVNSEPEDTCRGA